MTIVYESVTGEKTVIELDDNDECGQFILQSRRDEHALNERERYHTAYSLDAVEYEGTDFAAAGTDPLEQLVDAETLDDRHRLIEAGLAQQTETQRRRVIKYAASPSYAEIARGENASLNSVKESIRAAQKKARKIL